MKHRIQKIVEETLRELYPDLEGVSSFIAVDYPTQERFGDYTTNVAMRLASVLKKNPREIAQALAKRLQGSLSPIPECRRFLRVRKERQ